MECGLQAPAGCSVGPCGLLCQMWVWGSAFGDHNNGARSGVAWMGPLGGMLCVHILWGFVGICRKGFVLNLFSQTAIWFSGILCLLIGSKHHFSNPAPKTRTSVN